MPSEFETKSLGVSLEVEPTVMENRDISCAFTSHISSFADFVNYGGYPARSNSSKDALSEVLQTSSTSAQMLNQPIFEKSNVTTSVILKSGQTVVLGDMRSKDVNISDTIEASLALWANQGRGAPPNPSSSKRASQYSRYAFITVHLVNPQGTTQGAGLPNAPSTALAPAGQVIDIKTKHAYAVAVPGKPGFATSPYAPGAGYVDLRGYPPEAQVNVPTRAAYSSFHRALLLPSNKEKIRPRESAQRGFT